MNYNMKKLESFRLVHELAPSKFNPRNSEGDFLRARDGKIYFAYSRYSVEAGKYDEDTSNDHAPCDIYMIHSSDEGESWSEPTLLASAKEFGVSNIMSVSGLHQKDGECCFYFLVKELDGTMGYGRAFFENGIRAERCELVGQTTYYVINNGRLVRFEDGSICAPAARYPYIGVKGHVPKDVVLFISKDDGQTFVLDEGSVQVPRSEYLRKTGGYEEPAVCILPDGTRWLYTRTKMRCQYQAFAPKGTLDFSELDLSEFSSPRSPMSSFTSPEGEIYIVYNPIPQFDGQALPKGWNAGRTPLVIRKRLEDGKFGELYIIEDDEKRGYCYTTGFFTNDGKMLLSYCRGGEEDPKCLCRLGIAKIDPSEIVS